MMDRTPIDPFHLPTADVKPISLGVFRAVWALLVILCVALVVAVALVADPMGPYEATILLVILTSPLWGNATYFGCKRLHAGGIRLRELVLMPVALAVIIGAPILLANALLDDSEPVSYRTTILDKYREVNKNAVSYYAVAPCVGDRLVTRLGVETLPWPACTVPIEVPNEEEYALVEPGTTLGIITTHKGALGIPWLASKQLDRGTLKNAFIGITRPSAQRVHHPDYLQGLAYNQGKGVAKDDAKAVLYFTKAAEAGDAEGQYSLAYMYANGQGGLKQDWAMANHWLALAAEQGNARAMDDLGVSYGDGRGIAQDWVQAYMWLNLAARQGHVQAIQDLDYAKARMSEAQVAEAKAKAEAWLAAH